MLKKITRGGHERLQAEYEDLLHKKRPKVVKGITEAAAEGDRSENAEYIYGKKHLREIDKRLQYLGSLLKEVKIFDPAKQPKDKVYFGSTVTVQDDTGNSKHFMIVGEGETDFYPSSISEKSPVAQALLGKQVGDIVEIHRPKGLWEVEVIQIDSKD
ncbi:MAG: GreA/GreB family elongation factor [Myxococcaceae bacterium]